MLLGKYCEVDKLMKFQEVELFDKTWEKLQNSRIEQNCPTGPVQEKKCFVVSSDFATG